MASSWRCSLLSLLEGAGELLSTKDKGGMFDESFIHADEVEQSFSLALFPEMCKQEHAVETKPYPLLPAGHINNSAEDIEGAPINWYNAFGNTAMEAINTPEGIIGNPKKASAEKHCLVWNVSLIASKQLSTTS